MNTNELFSLKGKVAVVLGGTGELCGMMAEGLAAAGASTVIVGRSEEKAKARLARIAAFNGSASFEACEVDCKTDLENLLKNVLEKYGRVDILVNGAGTNSATPFLDITEEEFDRIMSVNVKGMFLACQVFGRYFLEAGIKASIINLGSESALTPLSRVFTYSASKAAVHSLSKNLAREWAPAGIRVNTLVPGFFPAEQNRTILSPDRIESIMNHTPMRRFGEANELIGATLLMAGEAGSFMTGAEIVVDGGYNAMTI